MGSQLADMIVHTYTRFKLPQTFPAAVCRVDVQLAFCDVYKVTSTSMIYSAATAPARDEVVSLLQPPHSTHVQAFGNLYFCICRNCMPDTCNAAARVGSHQAHSCPAAVSPAAATALAWCC